MNAKQARDATLLARSKSEEEFKQEREAVVEAQEQFQYDLRHRYADEHYALCLMAIEQAVKRGMVSTDRFEETNTRFRSRRLQPGYFRNDEARTICTVVAMRLRELGYGVKVEEHRVTTYEQAHAAYDEVWLNISW